MQLIKCYYRDNKKSDRYNQSYNRCRQADLLLNKKISKIAQSRVDFIGIN